MKLYSIFIILSFPNFYSRKCSLCRYFDVTYIISLVVKLVMMEVYKLRDFAERNYFSSLATNHNKFISNINT